MIKLEIFKEGIFIKSLLFLECEEGEKNDYIFKYKSKGYSIIEWRR